MKNISDRHCRENQNTYSITFFFENRARLSTKWENIGSWADHGRQYGARALHATFLRLQIGTQNINTYCFSTATIVAGTRLSITLYVHCLSSFP